MRSADKARRRRGGFGLLAWLLPWSVIGCAGPLAQLNAFDAGRELGTVDVKALNEISGLAASRLNPGLLWVHDDGDIKSVYAVRASGELAAKLALGEEAVDCEDIAIGPGPDGEEYLYFGDIGDNDEDRTSVRVLRVAEPELAASLPVGVDAERVEIVTLRYPDGPHNAEALLVDPLSGDVLVVAKEKGRAGVYRADASSWSAASPVTLQRIAHVDVEQVSAGDISRDGRWILLRREDAGWLFERRADEPIADALGRKPKKVPVRGDGQKKNGEAVAFHPDGSGYFTISEGKRQPICFFALP